MVSSGEIDRRYRLVREAMAEQHLDAVLVCGSEYTGFEGAVTYMSGFVIVHRYAYVLLPREGDPTIIFPAEAPRSSASIPNASRCSRSVPASTSVTGWPRSGWACTGSTT